MLEIESDGVRSARIALGGVGPYPWRIDAAEAAVSGAMPIRDNAYKLDMISGAVEKSLIAFI